VRVPYAVRPSSSSSHNVASYITDFAASEPGAALSAHYVSFAKEIRRRVYTQDVVLFCHRKDLPMVWGASPPSFGHTPANGPSRVDHNFLPLLASPSALPAYRRAYFPLPRPRDQNLSRPPSRCRPSNNYTHPWTVPPPLTSPREPGIPRLDPSNDGRYWNDSIT
jgi:hypothetical protein